MWSNSEKYTKKYAKNYHKKRRIESIFNLYRKHKFYTLFMSDINLNVTTHIDEVGGGRSNNISDSTAHAAIELADKKLEAERYVKKIENAVAQLPELEQLIIKSRYMCKDYDYISDYTIYDIKVPMSPNTYRKIRNQAFSKLYIMLVTKE